MIKSTLTVLAGLMLCAGTVKGEALSRPVFDPVKHVYKCESTAPFKGARAAAIERNNALLNPSESPAKEAAVVKGLINGVNTYGDIDAPDGNLWFYSIEYIQDIIEHEYYNDYIMRSFVLNIYNEKYELIGTIKDDIDYLEGEQRVVYCDILPYITTNFFNDDSKMEIVLGLAVNWEMGINNYRSLVYQIDGAKDSEGNDVVVATLPNLICDVLNAGENGNDDVYMSIMNENYTGEYPWDKDGTEAVWDYFMAQTISLDIYHRAAGAAAPEIVLSYEIPIQMLPGDQESTPMIITLTDNGKPYVVFSHYLESFYNPYYSFMDDISMRDGNSLVIDIYALSHNPVKTQTTTISMTKDEGEGILATYYAVGELLYRGDIDFHHFDTAEGQAAFIIACGNKVTETDDYLIYSYYVFNPDGTVRSTIFRNAQSTLALSDIDGFEPQHLFLTSDDSGNVFFNFVDLYSCRQTATFAYTLETEVSDTDALTSNIDRTPVGDSYQYAVEMRDPTFNGNHSLMRVAWFNADGSENRIDHMDMGSGVQYAMCYIDSKALAANFYHSDDNNEYMVLIKHLESDGSITENLVIGQVASPEYPEGRELLRVTPDERGALSSILVYTNGKKPALGVVHRLIDGIYLYSVDFYDLPLDGGAGVEDITTDEAAEVLSGPATIYNLQGVKVAQVAEAQEVATLPAGMYIVATSKGVAKVMVK
ncbi:MAG: hypothetical protein ACI31C_00115 [Muribaculaceae bacterium]